MMNIWTIRATGARRRIGVRASALAAALFTLLVGACDVHGVSAPGTVASITVTPVASLAATSTQQVVAVGYDAEGRVTPIVPTWTVVAGGGTITSAGMFSAGTLAGSFPNTVTATVGSVSGTTTITVLAGPLATIVIAASPITLGVTASQQLSQVGRDASGNVVTFIPTWSVVAGGGTITQAGLFTAGTIAATFPNTIQVDGSGIKGTATVIVTAGPLASIVVTPSPVTLAAGTAQLFAAAGRDAFGNAVAVSPTWSVVNGGGSIIGNTGAFTAGLVAGTFANTVKGTAGLFSATSTVTVTAAGGGGAPAPLANLNSAAPNGIMAGQSVTCITGGIINADVSISPGSTVTGYPPCVITGVQHLADAVALQGQIDLTTAYNTLAAQPCPPANAIVANLGGTTKAAGVYCTASSIGVTGTLTLDGGGNSNATFVFQAGTSLITAGNIVLINGAQAKNVFWQVGTSATLGTASQWQGNILALTSITLVDNATLLGRALARNGSVTLGTNNVIILP